LEKHEFLPLTEKYLEEGKRKNIKTPEKEIKDARKNRKELEEGGEKLQKKTGHSSDSSLIPKLCPVFFAVLTSLSNSCDFFFASLIFFFRRFMFLRFPSSRYFFRNR